MQKIKDNAAATLIQAAWKGYKINAWYKMI